MDLDSLSLTSHDSSNASSSSLNQSASSTDESTSRTNCTTSANSSTTDSDRTRSDGDETVVRQNLNSYDMNKDPESSVAMTTDDLNIMAVDGNADSSSTFVSPSCLDSVGAHDVDVDKTRRTIGGSSSSPQSVPIRSQGTPGADGTVDLRVNGKQVQNSTASSAIPTQISDDDTKSNDTFKIPGQDIGSDRMELDSVASQRLQTEYGDHQNVGMETPKSRQPPLGRVYLEKESGQTFLLG